MVPGSSCVVWKFPVVSGIFWKPYVDHPCILLRVRLIFSFFTGVIFPCCSPPFRYLGWSCYLSSIPHSPLGLPSSIHAWPNLFPLAQLFLGLEAWMRTPPLPHNVNRLQCGFKYSNLLKIEIKHFFFSFQG